MMTISHLCRYRKASVQFDRHAPAIALFEISLFEIRDEDDAPVLSGDDLPLPPLP